MHTVVSTSSGSFSWLSPTLCILIKKKNNKVWTCGDGRDRVEEGKIEIKLEKWWDDEKLCIS